VGSVQNYVQFSDNFHVPDFYDDAQELIKRLKALLAENSWVSSCLKLVTQ
jgi:hypothetical protein